jgi:hypothetical protein
MPNRATVESRSRQAHDRLAADRFVVLREPLPQVIEDLRLAISTLDARASEILARCDRRTEIIQEFVKTYPHELIVVPEQSAPQLVCRYEYILGASDQVRDFETRYIRPLAAGVVGRRLAHQGGPSNGEILEEIALLFEWRPITARPGDVVIFDSFIPHRSEINRSLCSRRALFLTYNIAEHGDWYDYYYRMKRARYDDPMFHVGTPTAHARR